MGLLEGVVGGLGGLASGNVPGAIAGGLAGLFGGNGNARQTQGMNLRDYTPEERAALERAYQSLQANMQSMSPEQRESYIATLSGTYYEPMAREIQTSYAGNMGSHINRSARGGMTGSSRDYAGADGLARNTAGMLSGARANARTSAENSYYAGENARLASVNSSMGVISGISGGRRADSSQYTNYEDPNASLNGGMAMLGQGLTSPNSWWNQGGSNTVASWFGGGGQPSAAPSAAPSSSPWNRAGRWRPDPHQPW